MKTPLLVFSPTTTNNGEKNTIAIGRYKVVGENTNNGEGDNTNNGEGENTNNGVVKTPTTAKVKTPTTGKRTPTTAKRRNIMNIHVPSNTQAT